MAISAAIVVNPSLTVTSVARDGAIGWQAYLATREGATRLVDLEPPVARQLLALLGGEDVDLDDETVRALAADELLVDAPVAAAPAYDCRLAGDAPVAPDAVPDPRFAVQATAGEGSSLIEIDDAGAPVARYRVTPEQARAFAEGAEGAGEEPDRRALAAVGALAAPADAAARRAARAAERDRNAAEFAAARHTVVRDLLAPLERDAVWRYCRALRDRGYLAGEHRPGGRRRSHVFEDEQLRWLHHRGLLAAERITGRELAPYYTFLAFYHEDGSLPPHRDRSGCDVSISLAVDAEPAERVARWPLLLHRDDGEGAPVEATWGVGEGLLFDGVAVRHERPALPSGCSATYLLLHYVDKAR